MSALPGDSKSPKRTALYRLYDADDRLLYVGITMDPKVRMAAHRVSKAWWPQVARHTLTWLDSRPEAAAAEVKAIQSEKPVYNVSDFTAPTPVSLRVTTAPDVSVRDWVTFADIARRVVDLGLVRSMTGQGVKHIATTHPKWPVPEAEWRSMAHFWLLPWTPVEEFFREVYVEKKRGQDKKPRRSAHVKD